MFIDEKASSSLAKFINQFNITIVDTCSIMEDGFLKFADNLSNAKDYLKKENEIIVFRKCVKELKKHTKDKKNDYKRVDAIRGYKVIKQIKKANLVKFKIAFGNKNFADNVIYTYVSTHRIYKSILVITQDKNLCQDLKNLNQSLSQGGREIKVYLISPDGFLKENYGRPDGYVSKINLSDRRNIKPLRYPLNEKKDEKKSIFSRNNKDLIKEIQKADFELSANLNNPNVKRFEKIESIHDQLDRLTKISEQELAGIKLLYNKSKLVSSLQNFENVKPIESVKGKLNVKTEQQNSSKTIVTKSKTKKEKNVEKKQTVTSKNTTSKKKVTLEEAKAIELKLMANIFNPTYPKESKKNDLKAFDDILKSLKKADTASLKTTRTFIKNKLDELK